MAIVKMKKFSLLTFDSYKETLLKTLQRFEDVHFKDLQNEDLKNLEFLKKDVSTEGITHIENELNKVKFAMQKLEPYFEKQKGLQALTAEPRTMSFEEFDSYHNTYDYDSVYSGIKFEDEKINRMKSDITKYKAENENMKVWLKLDVALTELDRLKMAKYVIGSVSKVALENFRTAAEEAYKTVHIEVVGNIKDDVALLVITPSDEFDDAFSYFKTLGFSKITLNFKGIPGEVISRNNDEIALLQGLQTEALSRIKKLADEYPNLEILNDYFETTLERERASHKFLKMQTVFLVEGWVPEEEAKEFRDIVTKICGYDYYLEESDVEKDSDDVPIRLKNNALVSAFEDITVMFALPKYNEIDPTPILTPFYMLFFGLMLGDAGYGAILMFAAGIAVKFFNLNSGTKKFMQFFFFLGITTVLGGLLYGSLFGFPFFTPIRTPDGTYKAILDSQADVLTMMIASIGIGVIQIIVGVGVKGYMLLRDGKPFAAFADSFLYIVTLLSAIGMLLGGMNILPGNTFSICWWLFWASLVGLAATQGRESPTMVGKVANGLYSVYGLTGYVGDLVSYTRIAALALSGAYISYSFNLMAGLIPAGFTRIVFGSLVFLLGQTLNLGLSALGAYVHTCRLQYVEFFGKFYEGGGVPFNAFKLKNKYINIKK